MLELKLQYFGHLMQRASSLEKTLMLGKTDNYDDHGCDGGRSGGWTNPEELPDPDWVVREGFVEERTSEL